MAYDSLDSVDAQQPSNNKDNPHQYVIPGYASGILQPHEIPSRGTDEGRTIHDDKIHFVDPLSPNSFQTFDSVPSTSLTVPGIVPGNFQTPIEIPRPNIDLNETPLPLETPTNDPLETPVNSNLPKSPPSTVLELPVEPGFNTNPFLVGLVPPQIPSSGGVEIPRPNLNAHETPIDDSQNALNQGLLPPTTAQPNFNTFTNPNQDGPIIITDVLFAPKPSNGLLPPKDPIPENFDFQSNPTINNNLNSLPSLTSSTQFTGTIGGISTTPAPIHIPVQVIHDTGKVNKYTGTFGGAPGVLVNTINPSTGLVPPQPTRVHTTTVTNTVAPTVASSINKFTGTFGGSLGVLSPGGSATNVAPTAQAITGSATTQTSSVPITQLNKKTGLTFGGPAGVLRPFDNLQKN